MSSGQSSAQMPRQSGPPYLLPYASLGGKPTIKLDDPICAVLLVFFILGAIVNMAIFQINRKRDHKFIFSVMLFGFCMARITTLVMRIVWASRPTDINVAIAASIFVQAGVLILFVINLVFAQRVLRSYHPHFGWSRPVSLAFRFCYACVLALLIMVITATVDSFFTLDANTRRIDRDIQLFAGTFLAALAFLPVPIVILAALLPRKHRLEKFGQGRFRTKLMLLLSTSLLLSLGAGFRIGVSFAVRPASDPAWYHSKPCFYCFNFVIEIVVMAMYVVARFDRRFHIPDGSSGPGDYSSGKGGKNMLQKAHSRSLSIAERVNRESDVFGDGEVDDEIPLDAVTDSRRESDWEERAHRELEKDTPAARV